jgi:2,4-dienoyl-CoA reductase-like NADH-dependent reductase (Old Yellow Enzyme family)
LKEIENPSEIVNMFRRAVALAKRAGFDGIELLAQGYDHLRIV